MTARATTSLRSSTRTCCAGTGAGRTRRRRGTGRGARWRRRRRGSAAAGKGARRRRLAEEMPVPAEAAVPLLLGRDLTRISFRSMRRRFTGSYASTSQVCEGRPGGEECPSAQRDAQYEEKQDHRRGNRGREKWANAAAGPYGR